MTFLDRWESDWGHTGKGAKITLVILTLLSLFAASWGALYNLARHDYANAAAETVVFAYLFGCYVIWPYRLAWAVKRRGGNFTAMLTIAIVFSVIFTGLYYLVRWYRKPVTLETT